MTVRSLLSAAGPGRHSSQGIALVAVLWMVAALAILVGGIAYMVRVDTKVASTLADRVRAEAWLDGAIRLAAADMAQIGSDRPLSAAAVYQVGNVMVRVEAHAATGYVNLNGASPELLKLLFWRGAGLEEAQAVRLAELVVSMRGAAQPGAGAGGQVQGSGMGVEPDAEGGRRPFLRPGDLTQVPGIGDVIYDRIRDLIVAYEGRGQATVNPRAAPLPVLELLAGGNQSLIRQIVEAQRSGNASPVAGSAFDGRIAGDGADDRYVIEASLLEDGAAHWVRRALVRLKSSEANSIPWDMLYAWDVRRRSGPPEQN